MRASASAPIYANSKKVQIFSDLHSLVLQSKLPCALWELSRWWKHFRLKLLPALELPIFVYGAQGWKNCRVGRYAIFSFLGLQRVEEICATKSTVFQCFLFLAHPCSLWLILSLWLWLTQTHPGSFRLTLALSLALSADSGSQGPYSAHYVVAL